VIFNSQKPIYHLIKKTNLNKYFESESHLRLHSSIGIVLTNIGDSSIGSSSVFGVIFEPLNIDSLEDSVAKINQISGLKYEEKN
jgi:hypothetical protein